MGHIVISCMVVTNHRDMTQSDMVDVWIHMTEGAVLMDLILVLVLRGTMIFIVIILTRGVTRDIFQMILRKKSHLLLIGI